MSDSESKDDDKEDEEEDEDYPAIIIDNGSGTIKSGFASLTNDEPQSLLQSVVGHSKVTEIEYSDTYVGDQAMLKEKKLSLSRPIKHGVITNWDDMQTIWKHILESELKCFDDIEYSTVVLSETPLNQRYNREKTIQIMFETFNCGSYYTQNTAVFELYSHGQTTGMVVGVGFDSSYTVPIYQGYALAHATNKMNIGGNDVCNYLVKLLHTKGYNLDNIDNRFEVIEDIKKTLCYVSADYWTEQQNRNTLIWKNQHLAKYILPDGNEIILGSNRFESAEIFFQPQKVGGYQATKYKSLCKYAYDSLLSVNVDVRNDIASKICINGGSTLINGFVERFKKDFKGTVPMSLKMGFEYKPNRQTAVYIGASVFSSLDIFKDSCITSNEYEETGPKIVNRKCF